VLDAKRHDEIFSAVSHLPHTLAFALIADLAERHDARELFDFAGAGLRDFSRLAGSHPEMWRDICLANAVALRRDLAAYRQKLDRIDALLASGDATGLTSLFTAAHDARIAWIASVSVVDSGK
jgi:prephenate dehydrogenase